MNEVVKHRPTPPAEWSEDQVDLIKNTIAREQQLTDDELKLFLYTAGRLGLDPLAKQIYAIRRDGRITFQTGIDGYRLCAARSGEYVGSQDPVFTYREKEEGRGTPVAATVTVERLVKGIRAPFTATARWSEYYPGDKIGWMWRKMPHTLLGKCAEALALRKAFPAELAGVYTESDMEQADKAGDGGSMLLPDPLAVITPETSCPVGRDIGTPLNLLSDGKLKWIAGDEQDWPQQEVWRRVAAEILTTRDTLSPESRQRLPGNLPDWEANDLSKPQREPGEEPTDAEG